MSGIVYAMGGLRSRSDAPALDATTRPTAVGV